MLKNLIHVGSYAYAAKELAGLFSNSRKSRAEELERDKKINLLVGLTVGGAVGMAAGILVAPRSGKETRARIASGTEKVFENVQEGLHEAGERVRRTGRQAAQTVREKTENAKESVAKEAGEK